MTDFYGVSQLGCILLLGVDKVFEKRVQTDVNGNASVLLLCDCIYFGVNTHCTLKICIQ